MASITNNRFPDVLIIGAGPAGTSAAAILNKAGFDCVIVEKQLFPRFVIGESLLPRCLDHLDTAGLLSAVEARQYMIKPGALLMCGKAQARFDFSDGFTAGWKYAYQVPRADFDQTLADAVAAKGVPVFYEHSVTEAVFGGDVIKVVVRNRQGVESEITPRFVFDASGYGRVLPRLLGLERPSEFPIREALFTHYWGDVRPAGLDGGNIWVISHEHHEGVWFWVIPFADGRTSLGVVGDPKFFSQFSGTPETVLRAIVDSDSNAKNRCGAKIYDFEPRKIAGYAAAVSQLFGPGYALLGNAAEFLDPVFSSGVTIALESGARAAQLLIRQFHGEEVNWRSDYTDYVMRGVDTFRVFVKSWYDGILPTIFYSRFRNAEISRRLCSILAGYVWDQANPYVQEPQRSLRVIADFCRGSKDEVSRSISS